MGRDPDITFRMPTFSGSFPVTLPFRPHFPPESAIPAELAVSVHLESNKNRQNWIKQQPEAGPTYLLHVDL